MDSRITYIEENEKPQFTSSYQSDVNFDPRRECSKECSKDQLKTLADLKCAYDYSIVRKWYPYVRTYRAGCVVKCLDEILFVIERPIVDETGKYLGPRAGFPKGAIATGDVSAVDTALRELAEETGIIPGKGSLIATSSIIIPRTDPVHEVSFYFLVIIPGPTPVITCDDEILRGVWMSIGGNIHSDSNTIPTQAVIRVIEQLDWDSVETVDF